MAESARLTKSPMLSFAFVSGTFVSDESATSIDAELIVDGDLSNPPRRPRSGRWRLGAGGLGEAMSQ